MYNRLLKGMVLYLNICKMMACGVTEIPETKPVPHSKLSPIATGGLIFFFFILHKDK